MSEYIKESSNIVNGCPEKVEFTIQNGPIKEVGVNGCQIDDVVRWARDKVQGFQDAFPCVENENAIDFLNSALDEFNARRLSREKRNVEGTNQV